MVWSTREIFAYLTRLSTKEHIICQLIDKEAMHWLIEIPHIYILSVTGNNPLLQDNICLLSLAPILLTLACAQSAANVFPLVILPALIINTFITPCMFMLLVLLDHIIFVFPLN